MQSIIIDVRSRKEFNEGSYPGAINLPIRDFTPDHFEAYKSMHISLLCFSGNRAQRVKSMLEKEGFTNLSVLQKQMVHLVEMSDSRSKVWTVDRQFRLALGLLLGLVLLGIFFSNPFLYLGLSSILFLGLMYSAITDNCYLKVLITMMPWNTQRGKLEEVNVAPLLSGIES